MRKKIGIILAFAIAIILFRVPIIRAVSGSYDMTVRIVNSAGTVINGTASAVTASYNRTVRVVDSNGFVIDSFGGAATSITSGTTTITSGADKSACFDDGGVINCADTGFQYTKGTGTLAATLLSQGGNLLTSAAFGATLNLSTPPAIGAGTPAAGTFTTLASSAGATTSAAFGTALNLSIPPIIGGTTPAAGTFSTLASSAGATTSAAFGAALNLTTASLRWVWLGGSNATLSTVSASYFAVDGLSSAASVATYGNVTNQAGGIYSISNLNCTLVAANGTVTVAGGTSYVIALQKNGSSTSLTCSITTAISSCSDTSGAHAVTTAANDILNYIATPNGTPTALDAKCSVVVTG